MDVMTGSPALPRGREFTRADLHAMPADGNRYELVDGALIVTPAPVWRHQSVLAQLYLAIHAACPAHLQVLFAPFDVRIAEDTVVQPDLLVAPRDSFTRTHLPGPPLLAVEVLSPSTRHIDLGLKRSRYEAAGAESYWVVDADAGSVIAWELVDGAYVEAGRARGEEELAVQRPFPVRLVPGRLLG